MSYRNLVGHRYGLLVVVKDMGVSKDGHHRNWLMKCDCGNTCVRNTGGLSKKSSCGCEEKKHLEIMSKNNVTHGMTNTGLYRSFKGMKSRCYRKKDIHYRAYGGRGITICKEWLDNSKSFYDWALANGWKEGLTIERIDVNGNYCPENCKWIPMSEQYKNKQTPYQIRRKQPLPSAPKEEA